MYNIYRLLKQIFVVHDGSFKLAALLSQYQIG
jgi:hypothetical protein